MSERGLTWDAFGLSCPGSPSHIPVPPQQAHRDPASSGIRLRLRCARSCHPSALGGEEMLGPGKAAKKRHIFHSTPVGFNCKNAGGAGLGGLPISWGLGRDAAMGSCMRRMKEQLPWMLKPSSLASLPGAWAEEGNCTPGETLSLPLPVNILQAD